MSGRLGTRKKGFSMLELVVALAIFLVVCGVAFEMLLSAMKRYHDDSQLLNSFQEARFGLDQMVRDVNDAGFPPRNQYEASTTPAVNLYASTPFAWSSGSGYPNTACTIGGTNCDPPGDYDLIVETDIDPQNNNGVEWVRYQLNGTTLYRGVVSKGNSDPDTTTSAIMVPYIQNVMNNPPAAQLAALQAVYPAMYPSGPVPIFTYVCASTPYPDDCKKVSTATHDPPHVVGVIITLIVQAPTIEQQTGRPRLVQLKGEGRRINPD